MKRILLSTLVASSLLTASEYKYEITPTVGYVDTKDHVSLEDQKVGGLSVSRNLSDCKLDQVEVGLLQTLGKPDYDNSALNTNITRIFVNGIKDYKINSRFKLYALAGGGYERISTEKFNNDSGSFFNYGVGVKYAFTQKLSLRLDARHILKFDGDRDIMYTLGLSIPFGAKSYAAPVQEEIVDVKPPVVIDTDKDGIEDTKDQCPTTPKGVSVDQKGCELDDDHDGIVNSKDQCPTTQTGKKVDVKGCEILNKPEELGVLFETNSATIKSSDLSKFDKYVKYLKNVSKATIIVEAHTDSIGDATYNLKLSQKRANSVKEQLIKMGIESNRIEAIGYGETKPKVSNDTNEHRRENRRVTARIVTK